MNSLDRSRRILEGIACGDSLGKITSKYNISEINEIYGGRVVDLRKAIRRNSVRNWERGDITDDTLLTLMLADSLIEKGGFDRRDFARRLIDCPDPRGGSQIFKLKDSLNLDYVATTGETNGPTIRLASLPIVYPNEDKMYDFIISQSTLTHNGKESLAAALLLGVVYSRIVAMDKKEEIRRDIVSRFDFLVRKKLDLSKTSVSNKLELSLDVASKSSQDELCNAIEEEVGMTKYPDSSVVAAVAIGLYGENTRDILIDSVNRKHSGGDIDSTSAIIGAINYPFFEGEILSDWVEIIEERNNFSFRDYANKLGELRKNG